MDHRFESRNPGWPTLRAPGFGASGWGLMLAVLIALILTAPAVAQTPATPLKSSCIDCHSALDGEYHVTADQYSQDIHAQKGLTCASCHGGDPTSDDQNAMSKVAGFKGHIDRS